MLDAHRIIEADPDAVAEVCGIESATAWRIENPVAVMDVEQDVQHSLIDARQDPESMLVLREIAPRAGRRRPVVGVAIEKWLRCESQRLEVVRFTRRADRCGLNSRRRRTDGFRPRLRGVFVRSLLFGGPSTGGLFTGDLLGRVLSLGSLRTIPQRFAKQQVTASLQRSCDGLRD